MIVTTSLSFSQNKIELQENSNNKQRPDTSARAKLTRTLGTNQYSNTRCVVQDKSGDIWFGTTGEGVYRFDGRSFNQYTIKDGLNSNRVYSMLEDNAGNIWFGTDSGLCRYDGRAISSIPVTVTYGPDFFPNSSVNNISTSKSVAWSMLQDKSGKLWFGMSDGVYCYDGNIFTRFPDNRDIINKDSLQLKMVDCMIEDKNGNIWFGSGMLPGGEGICCYDGKSLISFKPNGDGWIRYMLEDKAGNIWLGTRHNGNWIYDGKNFTKYTEKERIGAPGLLDKAGNIWFCGEENKNGYNGEGGIWRYDGKSFKNFSEKDGLGNYSVWCMFEDRDGNIWAGTRNTGLYRYDGKKFVSFSE